jgi:hypothetical protein
MLHGRVVRSRTCAHKGKQCTLPFTVHALMLIESVRTCTLPTMRFKYMFKACRTGGVFSGALVRGASRSSNGAVECGKLTTFKAMCTMRQLGEKVETHLYPNCAAFTRCWWRLVHLAAPTRAVPRSKLPTFSCVHGFTFDVSLQCIGPRSRIKVAGVFALASHPGCHHLTFSAPLV